MYQVEDTLQVKSFREIALASSSLKSGSSLRSRHNYITRLSFSDRMKVEARVICHLGSLFPELEVAVFGQLYDARAISEHAKESVSVYETVSRMPRLREIVIGLASQPSKEEMRGASMMFFSIVHQAPVLQSMVFSAIDHLPPPQMELFCALKKWKDWCGINNASIRSLTLRGWALEWDRQFPPPCVAHCKLTFACPVLTHKGYKFSVPNVDNVAAIDCRNTRKDNLVYFMRHGGCYPPELCESEPLSSTSSSSPWTSSPASSLSSTGSR